MLLRAAPPEDCGRQQPKRHAHVIHDANEADKAIHRSATIELVAKTGVDHELSSCELIRHKVTIVAVFLPLGLAIAGVAWTLSRLLMSDHVLTYGRTYSLTPAASSALALYVASAWSCAFETMFYFSIACPAYEGRAWSGKAMSVLVRLLSCFGAVGVWITCAGARGTPLSLLVLVTMLKAVFFTVSEAGYLAVLGQQIRAAALADTRERDCRVAQEHDASDDGGHSFSESRQGLGSMLVTVSSLSGFFAWMWINLVVSLIVLPKALPRVRSQSPHLATLISIFYPIIAHSIMSVGMKVTTKGFMRENIAKTELHYAAMLSSGIIIEFVCKQAAYSAPAFGQAVYIMIGQTVVEVLSRWLMPHMLAARVRCQLFVSECVGECQRSKPSLTRGVVSAMTGKIGDSDEDLVDSTEKAVARESNLHGLTVLMTLSAEARNCMEYVAHCGVVAARFAGGDGMQGRELAMAWCLAVSLEFGTEIVVAFGKRWMDLKGMGRYTIMPLTWNMLGLIGFLSLETTIMCMMQRFCVLAW
eukprot:CAMPEP_0198500806 /NCGR_PEP_ID=MMETSP1462-20131121/8352_1 /TAXON_ID=1333877 /ORGANISM="Brandtodinium nutriculum, Strain RCC3387" /LENGTH=529 /DNA_ID=CAMNT_0044229825 /DNA_START=148 /DNA_END=1734 /DNA_ORIENTATION=+